MVEENGYLKGIDRSNKNVNIKFREQDVLCNWMTSIRYVHDRKIGKQNNFKSRCEHENQKT